MADIHDLAVLDAFTGAQKAPHLLTLADETRDLRYVSADGLLEPASGHIVAWCKGDGTTTTFTIGKMPANVLVKTVSIITAVVQGGGTAATDNVVIGVSGTTNKYVTAMTGLDSTGVETVTTVPRHETTAQTVLATFGTALTSAARIAVVVHYIKLPAVPA